MKTLAEFAAAWTDTPESHKALRDDFCARVAADPQLHEHREYIKARAMGFGDDSFHWQWKLIVDAMPQAFSFLEIGVHCGQVLSLVELLARRSGKLATIYGVSPYDGRALGGEKHDYRDDVMKLHDYFQQSTPIMIVGDSTSPHTAEYVKRFSPFHIVYIDGSHDEPDVRSDILSYGPMTRVNGYLVMDDSGCKFNQPWGFFAGIDSVSKAVDALLPPFGQDTLPGGSRWKHLGNVMHNRIFQRVE